jgi:hypothetical protein
MWNRGKLVIVGILFVALSAAAFSAWYHYRGQHRAQEFWGTTTAVLIAKAPQVELLRLGEPSLATEDEEPEQESADDEAPSHPTAVAFGDQHWKVLEVKDALAAKGIGNLRLALITDTTFEWGGSAGDKEPNWQYGLSFSDKRNWATVLFDFETGRVALTGGKKTARLVAEANRDFKEFFGEQFPAGDVERSDDMASERVEDKPAPEPVEDKPAEAPGGLEP